MDGRGTPSRTKPDVTKKKGVFCKWFQDVARADHSAAGASAFLDSHTWTNSTRSTPKVAR